MHQRILELSSGKTCFIKIEGVAQKWLWGEVGGERNKLWLASAEELGRVTLVIPVWHTHLIQAPDSLRLIIWFDPD